MQTINETVEQLAFVDDSVEIRQNLLLNNTRARYANYKNCRCQGVIWQPSDTEDDEGNIPVPEFETCVFTSCSFLELPEDAVIRFYGVNKLYNCLFHATQTVVIDANSEFFNCENVNIRFAEQKTYNLNIVATNVSFPQITSTAAAGNYPLNLRMTGGKLTLPSVTVYGDWVLDLTNVDVVSSAATCAFTGMNMTGCKFTGVNNLYADRVVGSNLIFTGTTSGNIVLQGGAVIGNKIENRDANGNMLSAKTGVSFNCEIDIANRVNMANRTMTTGSAAKTYEHNFNGVEVL